MQWLLFIQGFIYLTSGLWPVLSYRTFENATGPKQEKWLVKTLGWLLALDGGIFIFASLTTPGADTVFLSLGTALILLLIELRYTYKKILSKVYLYDALIEGSIVMSWLYSMWNSHRLV